MRVFWIICPQCKSAIISDPDLTQDVEDDKPCDECIWEEENYEAEKEGSVMEEFEMNEYGVVTDWNGGRPDILADLINTVWDSLNASEGQTWQVIGINSELADGKYSGQPIVTVEHRESGMTFNIRLRAAP